MKKLIASVLFCFSFIFSAVSEVEIRASGNVNVPDNSEYKSSAGFTAGFDVSAFNFRGRDSLYLFAGFSYSTITADGIDPLALYDGQLALGYDCRIADRFGVFAEGLAGIWSIPHDSTQNLDGTSGILYGGRAGVSFYVLPDISIFASGAFKVYDYKPESFVKNTEIALGVKYNLSRGVFGASSLSVKADDEQKFEPLFPVFYSRYNDHPFGQLTFINNEKNDIRDVEVAVFIEQFMANPDVSATFPVIKRGESFTADLTAFLNESILNNLTPENADAKILVSYKSLGKRMSYEHHIPLSALSRNSMTWADDRAAAAFVSPNDASASAFARRVSSIIRDEMVDGVPQNIQIAAAICGALKAYGLSYVVDPNSAFTDNVGTASVDFLQFPYQTLLYHGGDCDDLSILNCALFESLGIETAFITVPGHIYMAFDSGLTEREVSKISDGYYIISNGKVWIPLEITLCRDSFSYQKKTGYREWMNYKSDRAIIPLKEAWKEFKAIGIPDSDVKIDLPSKSSIIRGFKNNLN